MIKIALLGSTGSIGKQTLEIVKRHSDLFKIVSLSAGGNSELLFKQVKEFNPKVATLSIKTEVPKDLEKTSFYFGEDSFLDAIIDDADIVLVALVGFIGIKAVLKAIEKGKNIALANKESLVVGGKLVMSKAKEKGVSIFPVDSEHSAVWQSLSFDYNTEYKKIILTASGGAFRDTPLNELEKMTAADALKHPNWNMGKKITVDCATMINKGFEVMEAMWLFNAKLNDVEVVVHRESIIHSMVQYPDNAVIAELGMPSMEIPIQLALLRKRVDVNTPEVDFFKLGKLTFGEVEKERYPLFYLALSCAKAGENFPCALNAANEVAVDAFLKGKIAFTDIYKIVKKVIDNTKLKNINSLSDLLTEDAAARDKAVYYLDEFNAV